MRTSSALTIAGHPRGGHGVVQTPVQDRQPGRRHAARRLGPFSTMKTWTATTIVDAGPEAVLDLLTDPDAVARWAPIPFDVDELDTPRLGGGRPRPPSTATSSTPRGGGRPRALACPAASPAAVSASTSRSTRPRPDASRSW